MVGWEGKKRGNEKNQQLPQSSNNRISILSFYTTKKSKHDGPTPIIRLEKERETKKSCSKNVPTSKIGSSSFALVPY